MPADKSQLLTPKDALNWLSEALEPSAPEENPLTGMKFKDFIMNIFAQSFPGYDFDTWHIEHLCDSVQNAYDTGRHLCIVAPRYHLKSTVVGHGTTLWRICCSGLRVSDIIYMSYKDGMARYHMEVLKEEVLANPVIMRHVEDASPKSTAAGRFRVNGVGKGRIITGGVFTFKRGIHVSGAAILDDVLRDPENPLSITQLLKVEQHINSEIINIPNRGVPLILAGTPMHQQDVLLKLENNDQWDWVYLPARGPTERHNYPVLWPKNFDEEELQRRERNDWRAFQTEFMLRPALEIDAFFTREELEACMMDIGERNHPHTIVRPREPKEVAIVGGYDVGKKRHPSHLVVYAIVEEENKENPDQPFRWLKPIHQQFLDRVDYEDQVALLREAIANFDIDILCVDNTRAELEERGLPPQARLEILASKRRKDGAAVFSQLVSQRRIFFFTEPRYVAQILAVSNELQAPESVWGHGESFWSGLLASLAYDRLFGGQVVETDISEIARGGTPRPPEPSLTR